MQRWQICNPVSMSVSCHMLHLLFRILRHRNDRNKRRITDQTIAHPCSARQASGRRACSCVASAVLPGLPAAQSPTSTQQRPRAQHPCSSHASIVTLLTNNIEAPRMEQEFGLADQGWEFLVSPWTDPLKELNKLVAGKNIAADVAFPGAKDVSGEVARLRSGFDRDGRRALQAIGQIMRRSDGIRATG